MRVRRISAAIATLSAVTLAATAVAAPAQAAHEPALGTTSLVEVLGADGVGFDKDWNDFDIVEAAAFAVLGNNPSSAVGLLADGTQALTAFIPTDKAFRNLAFQLTGTRPKTEAATVEALAGAVGLETIEAVLLYHVVPGATVAYADALKANGAELGTGLGAPLTVKVTGKGKGKTVKLVDADLDKRNARVIKAASDLNAGNLQIAHGIDMVLRPIDLP